MGCGSSAEVHRLEGELAKERLETKRLAEELRAKDDQVAVCKLRPSTSTLQGRRKVQLGGIATGPNVSAAQPVAAVPVASVSVDATPAKVRGDIIAILPVSALGDKDEERATSIGSEDTAIPSDEATPSDDEDGSPKHLSVRSSGNTVLRFDESAASSPLRLRGGSDSPPRCEGEGERVIAVQPARHLRRSVTEAPAAFSGRRASDCSASSDEEEAEQQQRQPVLLSRRKKSRAVTWEPRAKIMERRKVFFAGPDGSDFKVKTNKIEALGTLIPASPKRIPRSRSTSWQDPWAAPNSNLPGVSEN